MKEKHKEILNLIFTTILVICALIVTGLLGMNMFLRFEEKAKLSKILESRISEEAKESSYHLSEPLKELKSMSVEEMFEKLKKERIRGFPIGLEFATIVPIADHKMIFLPIIMKEPKIAGKINFGLVNPIRWDEPNSLTDLYEGRRSLWYMPLNSTMLYGILIDPQFDNNTVGVGYIVVKRITDRIYDVILQDDKKQNLFAARGELLKINKEIGEGSLLPLENQEIVKEIYSPIWNIKPEDFILFCKNCNK
jgi:hypothetical protein